MANPKRIKYNERFTDFNGEWWECFGTNSEAYIEKIGDEGKMRRDYSDTRRKSGVEDRRTVR